MTKRWRPVRDERGQGVLVLILVAVVVLITVFFLTRTLLIGRSINSKAEKIAQTGRGINTATDAILQLYRTERFGRSIHASTDPLEAKSNRIVAQAQSIDGTATSINNSAISIGSSANSIGSAVSSIQGLARLVDRDAALINRNVRQVIITGANIDRDLDSLIAQLRGVETRAGNIAGICETLPTC